MILRNRIPRRYRGAVRGFLTLPGIRPRPSRHSLGHRQDAQQRVGVVRILLEDKSVQVNVGNEQGETALHLAAGVGAFEIARLLIAHGANVQAKNDAGRTPAMVAKAEGYASLAEFIERSGKK